MKWNRVVSENGKVWIDGIKKRNPSSVIPENAKGFIVTDDKGNVKFISDEDMNKPEVK